jgi:DDE superfamily endonuclease
MRKSYSRGAMLTPEPHTVTAALRVMGLAREERFTNYHRVLNRATWSARQAGRILLGLLIALLSVFRPETGLDDALVPVPWARRVWALPFLTVLC